ncbi:hypothetical protein NC652_028980 [Populus alba x Populus x berolinensis]|nr:hypothetical protein NC652_028980 [Populus alba x Populus x berolinensis]
MLIMVSAVTASNGSSRRYFDVYLLGLFKPPLSDLSGGLNPRLPLAATPGLALGDLLAVHTGSGAALCHSSVPFKGMDKELQAEAGFCRKESLLVTETNKLWTMIGQLRGPISFMGTMTASSLSREASNYDEVSMQQSLLFSDSLKDLKNLRSQLYSAAEYFELSYTNDDQKQIVVETLKDYAIKALVNTVDHLGSVTYKVNDLLDEKVDEVSGTEFRVCCIEQRLRTCQEYIDHEGISQQSLVIDTPKYHKRYILPGNDLILFLILLFSAYIYTSTDFSLAPFVPYLDSEM